MEKTCHITAQSRVLDVAAGTGKFTTMLGTIIMNVKLIEFYFHARVTLKKKKNICVLIIGL